MARSSLSLRLMFFPVLLAGGACGSTAGPVVIAPALTCDATGETLTFDLPCQVGYPLAGTASAMECSAHDATATGKWSVIVDLGAMAAQLNRPIDLSTFVAAPSGTDALTIGAQGFMEASQVDVTGRSFAGRFVDVTLTLGGSTSTVCRGQNRELTAVPGQFI